MHQACFELSATTPCPVDRTGFDIGWDHAHHGLVPPPQLLLPGSPVCQGWMAGKALFGRRTLASKRPVRQWLQLRLLAWRQGVGFELAQLTPHFLGQIDSAHCPVRRCSLGGGPGHTDAAQIERLNTQADYAAGNLAVMSAAAASAHQSVDVAQAVRHARSAELCGQAVSALTAAQWWRLATLRAFATPLPFDQAARLPLAVLPPNRVRVLNASQGLQALVTQMFSAPGWAARCRAFAQFLPEHTLRLDFNLFVGAMAPRVLEAGAQTTATATAVALRHALEDAWLQERVQRRWQHLVLSLGEVATAALLARAVQAKLVDVRVVNHAPEQATEGWSLPSARLRGVAQPHAARALSAQARPAARPGTVQPPAAPATHA